MRTSDINIQETADERLIEESYPLLQRGQSGQHASYRSAMFLRPSHFREGYACCNSIYILAGWKLLDVGSNWCTVRMRAKIRSVSHSTIASVRKPYDHQGY